MANPLFAIRKAKSGEFYFYLRAENSEIIATSEMYKTRAGAQNGIASVKKNAPIAATVDMTND
tara:strand:- start:714 stop:902 length:189 start_codon:yes stop_codon:yes gene_type:complete